MKGTGRLVGSIVFVLLLVATAVIGLATSVRPLLGLDLVGGISVVLSAPEGTDRGVMERALDSIRERVDALGVAEPDIALVGGNLIQVQLPGLGGQGSVEERGDEFCAISPSGRELGCFDDREGAEARARAQSVQRVLQIIGRTARLEQREALATLTPTDSRESEYWTIPFTEGVIPANDPFRQSDDFAEAPSETGELVTYQDDDADGAYTPPAAGVTGDRKYRLGPVEITGDALDQATAVYQPGGQNVPLDQVGWQVQFQLTGDGAARFSEITTRLQGRQLAIVLDGVVQSAPTINEPITGGQGQITGGFDEAEAKDLAVVLNAGALPVELQREEVMTVSPTLGEESLRQGILAGVIGLILLMLYLAFYYRLLGVVTWFGMAAWAVLAVGLVSVAGATIGYALTLAGVAGLVVSLGITADSYIVFYERLKDEVRHGKSLRASVGPAFKRAWRTIVAADIVTITAALVLYLLAVGSVRGFALTLGLSTALDMFVVYFFKRPLVFLIARSRLLSDLRGVGLRSGMAADPVPVAGGER
jgi:preprotein translocase subunit SecD